MSAAAVIQQICEYITTCQLAEAGELLPLLSVARLSPEHSLQLLCILLQSAADPQLIRLVVGYFDTQRTRDPLPMLTQLLRCTQLPRERVAAIVACFPEKSAVDYYIDLVNLHDETAALQVMPVIQSLFPALTSDEWLLLLKATEPDEETEEIEFPLLRTYFTDQLEKVGRSRACPTWVRALPQSELPVIDLELPTVEAAVTLLLERMDRDMVATAEGEAVDVTQVALVRQTLVNQYCLSTVSEKLAMLRDHMVVPTYDDSAHFQEFGPLNTLHTVNSDPHPLDHPCGKYGGCRMLLCSEFEHTHYDEDLLAIEEHQVETDWWRKVCDECHTFVARHHALRLPLFGGGWKGCYCSVKCLSKRVAIDDAMTGMMIGRMMEQLECWGIRDRTSN